jgi:hypothetical protein
MYGEFIKPHISMSLSERKCWGWDPALRSVAFYEPGPYLTYPGIPAITVLVEGGVMKIVMLNGTKTGSKISGMGVGETHRK